MTNIDIGIVLPKDAVTQKIAYLGRTGSGKSYGATKLAEELYKVGAQFIVLDPVGIWWGIRLSSDGKKEGIPIPVFGGLHGDIPLEPGAGKLVADVVVERRLSVILDISQFEHNTDKARFAEDFATRFFFKKKSNPSAVHLFLEEAQEFIPQNPAKGEERMLGAFERLWKLGRNFGIGGSIISQRPQEVNKKAINQTECILAFQMTGTHERKAIEDWTSDKGIDEDISAILPKLEIGEARIWSPQWLKISETIKIKKKHTYDASSTPKLGEKFQDKKPLAPTELDKLKKEMQELVVKAEAEDPDLLKKRIRELENQMKIQTRNRQIISEPRIDEKQLAKAEERGYKTCQVQSEKVINQLVRRIHVFVEAIERINECRNLPVIDIPTFKQPQPIINSPQSRRSEDSLVARRFVAEKPEVIGVTNDGSAPALRAGAMKMLKVVASYDPEPVSKQKIATLAGLSIQSGTFGVYLNELKRNGWIEENGSDFTITREGKNNAGQHIVIPSEHDQILALWRPKFRKGAGDMLAYVCDKYPGSVTKEELADGTGMTVTSGTFGVYLNELRRNGLVEIKGKEITASEEMFPGG